MNKQAKLKAKELLDKYSVYVDIKNNIGAVDHKLWDNRAIECAKIAVDEIISYIDNLEKEHMYGFGLEYWQQVKNELNKML